MLTRNLINYICIIKRFSFLLITNNIKLIFFLHLDIDNIWTGIHEEGGYLVWDEISPHKVRAYNEYVIKTLI